MSDLDPSPTPLAFIAGDVRAADAPGIAGGPLEALGFVVLLGLATALLTVTIVRLMHLYSR